MKERYIDPFSDFGFKKIFGEEASKPQLIDFLNSLLPVEGRIKDLTFKNNEQLGKLEIDRKCIYDLYCESDRGEKFIVELQKLKFDYFKDRMIYYSTFPIQEQAERGIWDFNFKAVFCVGILDFVFPEDKEDPEFIHQIQLKNEKNKIFSDKLHYIYLEMPKFNKSVDIKSSHLDKWVYFLKNLNDLQTVPDLFQDEKVFLNAFEKAEISKFSREELEEYETSLKAYRDMYCVVSAAKSEGKLEERKAIAKNLKNKGFEVAVIAESTGLTLEDVQKL